jgi:tetratricopeptide (TPR) repeat protein
LGPARTFARLASLTAGSHSSAASSSHRSRFPAPILLALALLAAYWGSFRVPFHFDDGPAIIDNPTIRHLWPLSTVLQPPSDFGTTVNGRPLVNLTLALNYAVGGTDVRGYHVVNFAIHLLATLTLFGIARRTLKLGTSGAANGGQQGSPGPRSSPVPRVSAVVSASELRRAIRHLTLPDRDATMLAFVIALLWALHPLQTESVTYVVQRAESLAGLFCLLTLYWFIRGLHSPRRTLWFGWSMASCLLGAATKETAAIAPLLVLLYDRTFSAGTFAAALRQRGRYYLGLAVAWLVLAALILSAGNRGGTAGFGAGVSSWDYALTQCRAVVLYLRLAFWPQPLVVDYGMGVVTHAAAVAPQFALLAALFVATLFALRRWPAAGFAGAWFFLTLAPSSSIVPVTTQTMAEHRMYLPLAAVIAVVATLLYGRPGRKSLVTILAIAAALGVATSRRDADYRNALILWSDTVAKVPTNARAQNNLGKALIEIGDVPSALTRFQEALRLMPDYPETQNNLGYALAKSGKPQEAVAHFEEALRLRPTNARAHDNFGDALLQLNRAPEALVHFEAALRLRPDLPDSRWGLGNALVQLNRVPEAIARYEEALRLDSAFAEAHFGLAAALAQTGHPAEAVAHYHEALRLKPAYPEAENNLANQLFRSGQSGEAIAHYETALRLKPDYSEARINLGNTFLEAGRPADADTTYREALRLKPDDAEAHFGLGNTLAQTDRMPEAVAEFRAALKNQPDHMAARANLGNALLSLGRAAEAIEEYQTALRLKPEDTALRANLEQARTLQRATKAGN